MLTGYFYNKLREELSQNFTLVDQRGPGVIDLQVALVNVESATPGLRTVSVAVPQARILSGVKSMGRCGKRHELLGEEDQRSAPSIAGSDCRGSIAVVEKKAVGVPASVH